ncbi:disease resistance protein SUMM2-like [Magnolia sinica]|uniref:disease resistance protein SUMM2-like n=1 Tax=Magnolia sinica TaxID=86752 RepID=UPI002658191E|nr:disease resistance protein SUMM2-like [Magnolia sinica]
MEFFWEATKNAWAQYNCSRRLEENLTVLRTEMRGLSSRECDIKNELKRVEVVHGRKLKEEVSLWLENVEKITSEATKVEEDCREVRRYFSLSRVALGKLVIDKIEEVVKLKEKGQFSGGLLADLVPESGSMPMMKLVGRTRDERNSEEIWESLMDRVVKTIGVYGMAGVGKTTIMTQIHDRITRSGKFGHAVWVKPPNDSNIERLQNGIGQAIALDLSHEEDEMRRSVKLLEALKWRGNNFIIIFDEVCKPFPLEKVGIPKGDACKIILTTRSKNVCRDMKCDRKIEVEVLSREEAWKLFKERLGANVVLSMEVEPIAKLITEECGGLPLGIITVANAMREKNDVREWRKALEELKCSTMEMEGMGDQVFRILKFSYDRIKSERSRSCFLYCALFEEGYGINDEGLIEHWVAEGLIDDMGDWEKELDKGHTILKELIDLGLLVSFDHSLLMHDLIRDLAIGITRKTPRFVVKVGTGIRGSIGVEEFTEDVERISLIGNEIEMLSGEPNCPKLSTLLLKMNFLSGNISHEFFNRMKSLRVLDLSITKIEYLPASVSNLENLRVLLLENCRMLREVPSLEKLKHVKLLNLSATDIKELPHGMECLVNLKELCVSSSTTNRLNAVGCNSLVLPGTIVKLEMSQCELSSLPYLSPLQRLQKCSISWCSMKWLLPIRDNSTVTSLPSIQSLNLYELPSFRGLCEGVLLPGSFACLGRLVVDGCNVLESLMSVALFQHLQCLEHIEIQKCSEMEEVIQGGEEAMVEESDNNNNNNTILLPKLKELYLHRLGKLKSICKLVLTCPSLNKIHIVGCHRLKTIPLSLGHSTSVVVGEIEGSRERWDASEWDDSNTKTLLLPLFQEVDEAAGGGGETRGIKRKAEEELQQVARIS